MTSKLGLKGTIRWDLYDETGALKGSGINHNLVVNEGLAWLADRALPAQAYGIMKQIVLGIGTATPGSADTWVTTAFANNGGGAGTSGSVSAGTIAGTTSAWRYVGTFAAGYATQNGINEAIVTNGVPGTSGADPGTSEVLAHALFSPGTINKGASDTLVVTWDFNTIAS